MVAALVIWNASTAKSEAIRVSTVQLLEALQVGAEEAEEAGEGVEDNDESLYSSRTW